MDFHNRHIHEKWECLHGDLKTDNILVCDGINFKLADFGMTRLIKSSQSVSGTTEYMAPETVRCDEMDESSELYSLGVILYEAWFNQLPFTAKTLKKLRKLVRKCNQQLPIDRPQDPVITDLIKGLICKKSARYDISQVKNHDFFHEVEDIFSPDLW